MNKKLCKKLVYGKSPDEASVILGIVEDESELFLKFRTAKKCYTISKRFLISLEDTDEIFRGEQ